MDPGHWHAPAALDFGEADASTEARRSTVRSKRGHTGPRPGGQWHSLYGIGFTCRPGRPSVGGYLETKVLDSDSLATRLD